MHAFCRRAVSVASLFLLGACAETTAPANSFTATLRGESEVPAVVTTATGTATFTISGTNINYTVTWTGLSGNASVSHIHVGAAGATGSVRLNLCGTTGIAACPTGTAASITGVAALAAPYLTGVTPEVLLENLRNFGAYANVHTAANTGGEIRGQILGVP